MKDWKYRLKKILKDLGIRPNLKGYSYIVAAVEYMLTKETFTDLKIVNDVYVEVAKKLGKGKNSIERDIRYSIERMYNNCDPDAIAEVFGKDTNMWKGKLSNKEFLWTLADRFYDSREEGCESENETTDCEMERRILQFADYADCVT